MRVCVGFGKMCLVMEISWVQHPSWWRSQPVGPWCSAICAEREILSRRAGTASSRGNTSETEQEMVCFYFVLCLILKTNGLPQVSLDLTLVVSGKHFYICVRAKLSKRGFILFHLDHSSP